MRVVGVRDRELAGRRGVALLHGVGDLVRDEPFAGGALGLIAVRAEVDVVTERERLGVVVGGRARGVAVGVDPHAGDVGAERAREARRQLRGHREAGRAGEPAQHGLEIGGRRLHAVPLARRS